MTISRETGRAKAGVGALGTAIRTRGLKKNHDGVAAVDGVDLEAKRGEIFGLLGPKGAGKTTMMETIGGREKPDAGVVEVAGRIGVRPQDAVLFGYLTLHETLATFADLYDTDYSPTRVRELLGAVSLTEKASSRVDELSCLQKQRFYLALALVNDPKIILLDEPTASLDPPARREVRKLVRRMRARGITVVLATGDAKEAGELCDRVALVDRGRISACGTPRASIRTPGVEDATVAAPVGSAPSLTSPPA